MRSKPKRHTSTPRNRCAGTTQALHTSPKACMLTSKATCTYTREYMHIHKEIHEHIQRSTYTYTKGTHALTLRSTCVWPRSGNACFEKHANTPREQMPLNMVVHAHTPRSTCAYIQGVHTLIRKEHMHLYKEVHAFGQEVVLLALRNTRTRQGNRCP